MNKINWKFVLYYALHITPVILILVFTYTDVLYNFKEPVLKQEYTMTVRFSSLILLLIINIVLKIRRKILYLPPKKHLVARIIIFYLGISLFPNVMCGGNKGIQFYSPDKTNIITFEKHDFLSAMSVRVRKSYYGLFSVPIELEDNYQLSYSVVYADFKWLNENNLYVKIYPGQEHIDYPEKYYSIINLERSEIISKEQYESLNAEEYSFEP